MAETLRQRFDIVAAVAGPIRAARAGLWVLFGITAFFELTGLVLIGQSLVTVPEGEEPRGWLAGGVVLLVLTRLALGMLMPPLGDAARRQQRQGMKGAWGAGERLGFALALSAFVYALTLWRFVPVAPPEVLTKFPNDKAFASDVAGTIDDAVRFMTKSWSGFFDVVTAGLRSALNFVELVFVQSPWPVTVVLVLLMAWRLAGPRTTVFAGAALAYLGLLGLWTDSMATLALVAVSVGICVVIGLPAGIAMAKSTRLKTIVEPVLDVMQTLPTFVYLIPAVALFSIGKPPGVIATVIFALPSMIRPTELGIRQVPENVREAANAFGAHPWQLLWKVELPLATPSIRLGVNQTIMMCLSMVVVAALIGAGGLGQGVMQSLQHLQTGKGFVVGFAIVLIAMVLDRMLRGREEERRRDRT